MVDDIESFPKSSWRKIRVAKSKGTRILNIHEEMVAIKDYGKKLRQVAITGHGKKKPAVIITNDFDINLETVVEKYAKRWLVEKSIAEQTHFYHLNKLSSDLR